MKPVTAQINRYKRRCCRLCPAAGSTLTRITFTEAHVLLLGPGTPLSPILFGYGVNFLSGVVVKKNDTVLQTVGQGANFRQLHQQGIRLVTMENLAHLSNGRMSL
ncbi:MAG: hypothetical protein JXM69_21030 [Anaerolineae bacterium]|nr:hypothetical protein [Anaerolineae bacterium]